MFVVLDSQNLSHINDKINENDRRKKKVGKMNFFFFDLETKIIRSSVS